MANKISKIKVGGVAYPISDSNFETYRVTNDQAVTAINAKIPTQASSSNQLADKEFVNSSISTNTAEFKGTFNSLQELEAVTTADANDYGFVISTDDAGNTVYKRYKYVDGDWVFEYNLNNSSFTAAQWAAIQSGITTGLVDKLNGIEAGAQKNAANTVIDANYVHTDNNYTTAEKTKLSGIESDAQVNKIEHITLGGTEQTISNKTVNLPAYPTTLPASDVSAWAKAATKPTYTFDEITSKEEKKAAQEFVYRKNPTAINAKSLSLDRIYGKTLAWNQRYRNSRSSGDATLGITFQWVDNYSFYYTGTASSTNEISQNEVTISGHKYYFSCFNGDGIYLKDGRTTNKSGIATADASTMIVGVTFLSGKTYSSSTVFKPIFIDLTLMFGAGNEPSTVEEFESMFPGYHEYNAGTLISNDAESIETIGFNLWNEETRNGYYDDSGNFVANGGWLCNKNLIPVFENTTYYIQSPKSCRLLAYDANGTFLSSIGYYGQTTFTTPDGTRFINFHVFNTYGNVYNHDICINLSDPAKNGTYEPYRKSTMQLGLNSIKVKSHNIWDEEWEVIGSGIKSVNAIPVIGGQTYYFKIPTGWLTVTEYDANGNAIGSVYSMNNTTKTLSANAVSIRFVTSSAYGTTYNHDICINLSSSFNGQYEPHGDITITGGLKSAGSIYDEIVGNKYIKRVGSVDLGTLQFSYNSTYSLFICDGGIPLAKRPDGINDVPNLVSTKYTPTSANTMIGKDKQVNIQYNVTTVIRLRIKDSVMDGSNIGTDGKIATLSGNLLYYELATPIEYELVSPLVPTVKAGITEARISPNSDGLSAPFCGDITYSVADYIEYTDRAGALIKGASVDLTDIVASGELSGNAFKVIAEHIAKLTSRVEALENGIGVTDTLTSNSVDSANGYYINGDKTILTGSGAPTVIPAFAGQFYINTSGPALYYAVNNSATTDWKQA